MTLRYNGEIPADSTNTTFIVQAYSGNNLQNEPSAVYSVTPGTSETRYLYLGFFEDRVFHGTLTPGWVVNNLNAFSLQVAHAQPDDLYSWTIESEDGEAVPYSGTYEEMRAAVSTYGRSCKVATHAFTWEDTLGSGNGGTGDGEFALKFISFKGPQKGGQEAHKPGVSYNILGCKDLWLLSGNPKYKPIHITEGNDFTVWGIVTYVIKKIK